ncbi:hypothetical protein HY285_00640 [Candidatus Peregrinibacteria bacterium]|nr:hypothetical protein [Candidatus Peregrinibacteria bacterium]MBI3816038.1 hypothetical protein [Candidatus Peregrinibacteria bacterium]
MRRLTLFIAPFAAWALPLPAWALEHRTIIIRTGITGTFPEIMSKVVSFLAMSSVATCLMLFLIGAFLYTTGVVGETQKDTGKKTMINALLGLLIILGSYALLRTVLYYICAPSAC